jgi:hypothetical protein
MVSEGVLMKLFAMQFVEDVGLLQNLIKCMMCDAEK